MQPKSFPSCIVSKKKFETKLENGTDRLIFHISKNNGLQTKEEVVTNDDSSGTNNISKRYG